MIESAAQGTVKQKLSAAPLQAHAGRVNRIRVILFTWQVQKSLRVGGAELIEERPEFFIQRIKIPQDQIGFDFLCQKPGQSSVDSDNKDILQGSGSRGILRGSDGKPILSGSDGKRILRGSGSRCILRSIDDQVILWGRMIKSLRITKAFVFFTDRNRDRFIFSGAHQNGTSHYFVSIVRTTSMFCMI